MDCSSPPAADGRRTRIVATLGPASASPEAIKGLIRAGADVLRLNLSHGDRMSHRLGFHRVRQASLELGRSTALLADLCGPKIRVGTLPAGGIALVEGARVAVTNRAVHGTDDLIPIIYDGLSLEVERGTRLLLDDGVLELRIERVESDDLRCTVVRGGTLVTGKGVNVPATPLSLTSLTAKDLADVSFAVSLEVDFLALSYVRSAADVHGLRTLISSLPTDHPPLIIAKIETQQALDTIDDILMAADGIMVARGDLGVEIGCEKVPHVQHDLVTRARAARKPVIVATQMLESMVHAPVPTRAEVADVAHAVLSGADATMLSAETATGRYPIEAVEMMARVTGCAERARFDSGTASGGEFVGSAPLDPLVAFGRTASELSCRLWAAAIVVFGEDEGTVTAISAARPRSPIVVPVACPRAARRLALLAGVVPVVTSTGSPSESAGLARRVAALVGADAGDRTIVIVVDNRTVDDGTLSLDVLFPKPIFTAPDAALERFGAAGRVADVLPALAAS